MKKVLILAISLYILTLLQTSFLIHFNIFLNNYWVFNLVLVTVFLISFFASYYQWQGVMAAFIGGFFLDIFSENFFGFYILILVILSLFIKFVLKKYVQIPSIKSKAVF